MPRIMWLNGAVLMLWGAMAIAQPPAQPPEHGEYWVGIWCMPVPSALRAQLALPEKQGVLVENVAPDSPAAKAGIARYDILGGAGVKIAWPDVPQALQRGTVDALATTFESVRSAKLWDSGLKYAYVSQHTFSQYLPAVSGKSWAKYPKEIQDLITNSWAAKVDTLRARAKARQESAKEDAKKNGIIVVEPSADDLTAARAKLMAKQSELIKELNIDPAFITMIEASLKK